MTGEQPLTFRRHSSGKGTSSHSSCCAVQNEQGLLHSAEQAAHIIRV